MTSTQQPYDPLHGTGASQSVACSKDECDQCLMPGCECTCHEVAEPMLPKFMCRHCGFEVEAVGQPMCCGSNMAAHPDEWGRRQVALQEGEVCQECNVSLYDGRCPRCARRSAQPCGHPVSAVVSSDEGTAYCGMCTQEPTCGIAGCTGKHHPQDHNAIFDTSTDDQSRSLFHSLQDAIRERNALRAEVERMHPVVEAAIAVIETDKRLYHGAEEHAEAEAEAAFNALDEAVEAYRKDTNDE